MAQCPGSRKSSFTTATISTATSIIYCCSYLLPKIILIVNLTPITVMNIVHAGVPEELFHIENNCVSTCYHCVVTAISTTIVITLVPVTTTRILLVC